MADQHGKDQQPIPDPAVLARNMVEIAKRCRKLVAEFMERQDIVRKNVNFDPSNLASAYLEMTAKIIANPGQLLDAQVRLWRDYVSLFQTATKRLLGEKPQPVIEPAKGDKRFKDASWEENQAFDFIKQAYLLSARWIQSTVHDVEGMDPKTKKKVEFYTRQFMDAIAPSNFVLTNPEVLRVTIESNGENLVRGLDHVLEDLERGKGRLDIRMTDPNAFEVGRNIAVTPGKVIFRNDLMELLQYEPATEKVYKRPLLITPPWINKFYILDLKPQNSFIKWAVDHGYTVFVISWVNPDSKLAQIGFEGYMNQGLLAALDAVEQATGEHQVNAIGYCIGGTLTAATLAYLQTIGDKRIAACTFFAAQVDFTEAGELSVFVDEDQLEFLADRMSEKGYLEGGDMAQTFNMLRANDLIWSFVVNNYLLGRDPFPFDLLFWNQDATRMPIAMHMFYLRECYQKNKLSQPGGITMNNVPIHLNKVKVPLYFVASREDHIAPARSVFRGARIFKNNARLVLAGSGHIAGVINPPEANKYQHWINDDLVGAESFEDWLSKATEHKGSWWPDWDRWMSTKSGAKIAARTPGDGKLRVLDDAPGTYVKIKA
ncbi:class I poly(R)-hydroxyalkanoic acid synthase [Oleomonas cavernae]|uniref:Class I poly(R)-hydroxyalkanoic acid synthase n=1 Tax=Oleomonas cavernae TaxID=2320859 RepID=A0A418WB33_9PROT|nr:class I poly(R)-hydroxyalkanoic acid synthase [Oleomonas cavernae]RJF87247.1 class I poly(R)-hydroxyalkanoic acid synthase [Oleomonas cavernae]